MIIMFLVPSAQTRSPWAPVAAYRFKPLLLGRGVSGLLLEANILCTALRQFRPTKRAERAGVTGKPVCGQDAMLREPAIQTPGSRRRGLHGLIL